MIECKSIKEELTKYDSQLFRYFGTTKAKFAILTNGIIYRFYTDLDEPNKMDEKPFLEIDMIDLKDAQVPELKKFHKDNFDLNRIIDSAAELKYMGLIRGVIREEFTNPSDDFTRYILSQGVYDGIKTQNIVDRYKPILKRSLTSYINDLVNDKIQIALKSDDNDDVSPESLAEETPTDEDFEPISRIDTTDDEIESFYVIKSILRDTIDPSRLSYKDTLSYFGILIDNKVTRWVCRVSLKERSSYIMIPDEISGNVKYPIEKLDDIYDLSQQLINRANLIK